jgi:hypothetical protein
MNNSPVGGHSSEIVLPHRNEQQQLSKQAGRRNDAFEVGLPVARHVSSLMFHVS